MSHQNLSESTDKRTALVLGGGGLTGTGWLIGMLTGLVDTVEAAVRIFRDAVVAALSSNALPAREQARKGDANGQRNNIDICDGACAIRQGKPGALLP